MPRSVVQPSRASCSRPSGRRTWSTWASSSTTPRPSSPPVRPRSSPRTRSCRCTWSSSSPSQHLGEQCVAYSTSMTTWPTPPLNGALAGFSWLAFELAGTATVPYTMAGLLDWSKAKPELVPVASSSSGPPAAPDPLHTALEVPWQLWVTPLEHGTWHHSTTPVTFKQITELWHTRLGAGGLEPPVATPQLKAFWAPGYPASLRAPPPADPWLMSLDPHEPHRHRDADHRHRRAGEGPVDVDLLLLSALGASVNLRGAWSPGPNSPVDLASWWHRASIGRDSYVRVVNIGYLFPWGNRAVRITITDREIQVDSNNDAVAYLVQKQYIVVTEPQITYAGDTHEPHGGRGNPIRRLLVKTVTTPPIDFETSTDPGIQVGSFSTDDVLWVRSGGTDVPFSFVGTDLEGRKVDFTTGVIWMSSTFAQETAQPSQGRDRLRLGRPEPEIAVLRRVARSPSPTRPAERRDRRPSTSTPTGSRLSSPTTGAPTSIPLSTRPRCTCPGPSRSWAPARRRSRARACRSPRTTWTTASRPA